MYALLLLNTNTSLIWYEVSKNYQKHDFLLVNYLVFALFVKKFEFLNWEKSQNRLGFLFCFDTMLINFLMNETDEGRKLKLRFGMYLRIISSFFFFLFPPFVLCNIALVCSMASFSARKYDRMNFFFSIEPLCSSVSSSN